MPSQSAGQTAPPTSGQSQVVVADQEYGKPLGGSLLFGKDYRDVWTGPCAHKGCLVGYPLRSEFRLRESDIGGERDDCGDAELKQLDTRMAVLYADVEGRNAPGAGVKAAFTLSVGLK
jgi:hypothetical protein